MRGGRPRHVVLDDITSKVQLLLQVYNAERQVRKVRLPQLRRRPNMEMPELQGGGQDVQVLLVRVYRTVTEKVTRR